MSSGWTLSGGKGLVEQIELTKMLPDHMQIVLVGKMQKGIKLPKNVLAVGPTDNVQELVKYYSMADVFLHLSPAEIEDYTSHNTRRLTVEDTVKLIAALPEVQAELESWKMERSEPSPQTPNVSTAKKPF